jgi:uncharacterized protein YbjT (DUF2867 family)
MIILSTIMFLAVTNILVTGATGNVGREVVRLLYELDYSVPAAVRNPK